MTKYPYTFMAVMIVLLIFGLGALLYAKATPSTDREVAQRTRDYCAGVRAAFELDARDLAGDVRKRDAAIDRLDGQHAQRSDLEVHLCTGGWPPAGRDACWIRRDATCLAQIATAAAASIR